MVSRKNESDIRSMTKNTATWREFLGNRQEVAMMILTLVVFAVTLYSYAEFLTSVELRVGVVFVDPIHEVLGPVDYTWPIFIALYGALIAAIISLATVPTLLLRALRAYTLLIAIRIVAMWVLPLDPPADMIPLSDPIVELFAGSGTATLTRDLFFSGHTATLFLIGFIVPQKWLRRTFIGLALAVGFAVIAQHVHYTVDVVVAPLAAVTAAVLTGYRRS